MCKQCPHYEVLEAIEEMLNLSEFQWAEDTLQGIYDWVEENQHVTERQVAAVNNIRRRHGHGDIDSE